MKDRTTGENLGLRCNYYYVTCKTDEEFEKAKNGIKESQALAWEDFRLIKCEDETLIVSKERVPAFRDDRYKEWKRILARIYSRR